MSMIFPQSLPSSLRFGKPADLIHTATQEDNNGLNMLEAEETPYITPMVFDKDQHPENVPLLLKFNEQVLQNFKTLSEHTIKISEAFMNSYIKVMQRIKGATKNPEIVAKPEDTQEPVNEKPVNPSAD